MLVLKKWKIIAKSLSILLLVLPAIAEGASFTDREPLLIIENRFYKIAFSKENGAISYILDKKTNQKVVMESEEGLLWQAAFEESGIIKSSQFSSKEKTFGYRWTSETNKLNLTYNASNLKVNVDFDFKLEKQFGATISVENRKADLITQVWFPSDINFSIGKLNQFIYPFGVGVALQPAFFKEIEKTKRYEVNLRDFKPCTADFEYNGPLFSDFVFIDSQSGRLAIYSVQSRPIMETSSLMVGSNQERLGFGRYDHKIMTYIPQGTSWHSAVLSFEIGSEIKGALDNYVQANKINESRTLKEKTGEKFERLAKSVLLTYDPRDGLNSIDNFSYLDNLCERLPVPSLIHYVTWNLYSDILFDPLSPDLEKFIETASKRGFLVMPFTVWTWFPSRGLDKKILGYWANKEGEILTDVCHFAPEHGGDIEWFMTSPYSPEFRDLLRDKVKRYVAEHKIDLLFEDAVGATSNRHDFNPASPEPTAYTQGLIEIVKEHSKFIPLMTEKGFFS